ncbi:MAG: NYN domain-containing protein [Anaerolineaceae bacterium]|jgi:predicted RNA-binding protein with PIN domain|nr:NYN domain-containing protein [Anaerolineaceae bacterium]
MILIDGHNLVPKIKGLTLSMLDDEMELIQILSEYARITRKKMEVYFDNAPFDKAGTRKFGSITAHFVRQGMTADEAMIQRVRRMGTKARNVKVISSDQRIIREVRNRQAETLTSEEFAKDIAKALSASPGGGKPDPEKMTEKEIEKWENLFKDQGSR